MKKLVKSVDIIGIQMDLGASLRGVNMGCAAIRHGDICNKMTAMGIKWQDKGDIIPLSAGQSKPTMKHWEQINEANSRLYKEVGESFSSGTLPIILGGDHCVAAGSVMAAAKHCNSVGLIWIDAHGDFNDEESTNSGNMHGMPFSAVCGMGPDSMVAFEKNRKYINPKNAVQIGGRDIEIKERQRMRDAGITVFSMTDIDKLGMPEVMRRAIEIAKTGTDGIHVSFDIDAVTPQEAPGVGTPVHSGLTVREAFLAAEMIAESETLISLDMVEVNPILDIANRTGELACELILSFLGKTVF